MATMKDLGGSYARNAGADLSEKLFYLTKVDTDGDIVLAAAATDFVLGPVLEAAVQDKPVTVQYLGEGKAITGGAITAGDRLTSDSAGKAIATTSSGNNVFGVALESAASGAIVPFVFLRGQVA